MQHVSLAQVVWLLAAAAIAAPLARVLRIGSVLGYLLAGVLIGPYGIGKIFSSYTAHELLEVAEFGVVLLLFLIGLELRPRRLMSMRNAILGLGGAQVALTGALLGLIGWWAGSVWAPALFAGLALSLSSTAFALQVLEEKGELTARHGRLAFAVLLFQDLAAIPLIALTPLFAVTAVGAAAKMDLFAAMKAIATIAAVVAVGYFVLDRVFSADCAIGQQRGDDGCGAVDRSRCRARDGERRGCRRRWAPSLPVRCWRNRSYRHQLEADLKPFEGLLLGLFFTAVGMSLNLDLLAWSRAGRDAGGGRWSRSRRRCSTVLGAGMGSIRGPRDGSGSRSARAASSRSCCSGRCHGRCPNAAGCRAARRRRHVVDGVDAGVVAGRQRHHEAYTADCKLRGTTT